MASWGEYQLDGMMSGDLPAFINGYPITHHVIDWEKHKFRFKIHLDDEVFVSIVSFKDYVSVKVENGTMAMFGAATGLMGDFQTGTMYGRDGSIVEDPGIYAREWQVRSDLDALIFSESRYPQYPQRCVEPAADAIQARARKLMGDSISRAEAEKACSSWTSETESCIQDVMATGDIEMALLV